jgi:hypothetical protein
VLDLHFTCLPCGSLGFTCGILGFTMRGSLSFPCDKLGINSGALGPDSLDDVCYLCTVDSPPGGVAPVELDGGDAFIVVWVVPPGVTVTVEWEMYESSSCLRVLTKSSVYEPGHIPSWRSSWTMAARRKFLSAACSALALA